MLEHSFNVNVAKEYGIPSAILLKNLEFWIAKNKANNTNFYDGYYWTYNSKKAFAELFPYLNARQIDYALSKLIDAGIIITGNYNKIAYDRTLWYAITKKGYSILQNCEMDESIIVNGSTDIVKPIPNNNTDINITNSNKDNKKERGQKEDNCPPNKKSSSYDSLISEYILSINGSDELKDCLYEFIKMRKLIKKPMTDRALKLMLKKLNKLSNGIESTAIEILEKSIMNNWQDIYELKQENKQTSSSQSSGNIFLDIAKEESLF